MLVWKTIYPPIILRYPEFRAYPSHTPKIRVPDKKTKTNISKVHPLWQHSINIQKHLSNQNFTPLTIPDENWSNKTSFPIHLKKKSWLVVSTKTFAFPQKKKVQFNLSTSAGLINPNSITIPTTTTTITSRNHFKSNIINVRSYPTFLIRYPDYFTPKIIHTGILDSNSHPNITPHSKKYLNSRSAPVRRFSKSPPP